MKNFLLIVLLLEMGLFAACAVPTRAAGESDLDLVGARRHEHHRRFKERRALAERGEERRSR